MRWISFFFLPGSAWSRFTRIARRKQFAVTPGVTRSLKLFLERIGVMAHWRGTVMRKLFVVCAVFSALLVVVAGCGDDAKPTASAADNLDDRLFGTWTTQDEDEDEISITFEEDGTLRMSAPGFEATGTWSTDGDKLTIMWEGGRYSYEITNGTLEFTTVTFGGSSLPYFSFTTDGDATMLTGVTWVDRLGDELVFSADGTYRWGGDSFVFEEGTWTADGNTITITIVGLANSSPYSVSDDTMTVTDDEGEEQVLTRTHHP